jgi:hypothetical protein
MQVASTMYLSNERNVVIRLLAQFQKVSQSLYGILQDPRYKWTVCNVYIYIYIYVQRNTLNAFLISHVPMPKKHLPRTS